MDLIGIRAYGASPDCRTPRCIQRSLILLGSSGINPFLNEFPFEAAKEGLCDRVIPAVATPTHGWTQIVVFTPAIKGITAKLTALVGVDDHAVLRFSAPDCHG